MNQKHKYQEAINLLKDDAPDDDGQIAKALDDIHRYIGELRRERAIPPTEPKVVVDDSASIATIAELKSVKERLQTDNKSLRTENKRLRAYLPTIEPNASESITLQHLTTIIVKVLDHYEGYNQDKVIALAHVLAGVKGKGKRNKDMASTVNAILEIIEVPYRITIEK